MRSVYLKSIHWTRFTMLIAILALAMWVVSPISAVAADYEYEAGEGVHKEEWYDPSDWFDSSDGSIEYENDWWDYTYNYPSVYSYDYDYDYPQRGYYNEEGTLYNDEFPYTEEEFGDHYDYYTDTWYDENDEFVDWYE